MKNSAVAAYRADCCEDYIEPFGHGYSVGSNRAQRTAVHTLSGGSYLTAMYLK